MTHELILASVEEGLYPNDHGFCPVAADADISPRVVKHLTSLNKCRPHNTEGSVIYSHLILPGAIEHVLSRMDNVQEHHVVLDLPEIIPESPAWLLALPCFHISQWNEPPFQFAKGRPIPTLTTPPSLTRRQQIARQRRWLDPLKMSLTGNVDIQSEAYLVAVQRNDEQASLVAQPTSPCPIWEELTGDPGWGGILAETAATEQPVVLLYKPGQNILPLFVEALALLSPQAAWHVTFITCFTGLPEEITCQWKGVAADSEQAKELVRDHSNLILDLTVLMGLAPPGRYVDYARFGQEHMLPLEDEEYIAALANADTKSYGEEEKEGIDKIIVTPDKKSGTSLPSIQLPKKQAGLFESFLRRSSRFQFYFLYSIMFALMLFLLFLAIDQIGNFGIVQSLRDGEKAANLVPPDVPDEEQEPDSEGDKETEPIPDIKEDLEDFLTEPEKRIKSFKENREDQREPLLQFLDAFEMPELLGIHYPEVQDEEHFDLPEKASFGEFAPLHPFAAALELRFIPLFELPDVNIETVLLEEKLPDLVWEVKYTDSGTAMDVSMFRFQWTDAGLVHEWQQEGLSGEFKDRTFLSSLGFLQLTVADVPEPASVIPLFIPKRTEPVKVADLVNRIGTDTPEYVVELPFASNLWQQVFAEIAPSENVLLEVWSEPEDLADTPSEPGLPAKRDRVDIEVSTSQQVEKQAAEGRAAVFADIKIQFSAEASLESVVWKGDALTERLLEEDARLEIEIKAVVGERGIIQNRLVGGESYETDQAALAALKAKEEALSPRRKEIANILEKLPSAYTEVGKNESWLFHYSVFLESADGERRLLVLTSGQ